MAGGFLYVGLSDSGNPQYTYGEAFLQKTSTSLVVFCSDTLREVMNNSDSRRIFWFLCANLLFCGVEFLYGFLTNSLGLISDGFHMFFDCSALVMGLVASVMSRWTANRQYSFGYGRVEVLAGFINALFLIVIAFFIFMEAIERLIDPPSVNTDKLLIVAVAGLLINLFGMYAFQGGHGHSHGGGSHSHGHHGHSHSGENANMQGVFLHVLADTLGSVFVIVSTVTIQWFGWQWVDPFCSLILSILIVSSVYPLLKSSGSVLMQCIPRELHDERHHLLEEILSVNGVKSYSGFHLWQLKSDINVASISVQVDPHVNEQLVRQSIRQIFRKFNAQQISVQVEKAEFETRIQSMVPYYRLSKRIDQSSISTCAPGHHSHGHSHGHSHDAHGHSHEGHSHDHRHDNMPEVVCHR